MKIFIGYILTYSYILLILLVTYLLQTKLNMPEEKTRKIVHIFIGFSWFIMTYYFKTSIHLIIPPLTFIFINYLSYKKGLIKPMERQNNKSLGTVFYAISFTILALITYLMPEFLPYYGLGVLTMAIADGLAPFISFNLKFQIGDTKKTYSGTLGVFVLTIIIAVIFNKYYFLDFNFLKYLVLGISAAILELIGHNGYDNLTLPIGLALIAFVL